MDKQYMNPSFSCTQGVCKPNYQEKTNLIHSPYKTQENTKLNKKNEAKKTTRFSQKGGGSDLNWPSKKYLKASGVLNAIFGGLALPCFIFLTIMAFYYRQQTKTMAGDDNKPNQLLFYGMGVSAFFVGILFIVVILQMGFNIKLSEEPEPK